MFRNNLWKRPIEYIFVLLSLSFSYGFISSSNRQLSKDEPPLQTVQTYYGRISGVPAPTPGVEVFKGIPYAAPPVGKLRWRAPQPPEKWEGILKADHFCDNCIQASRHKQLHPPHSRRKSVWTKPFLIPNDSLSENCLYLNIWTAASSPKERRPVMVWIHGGGFQSGSGSVPVYNGERMAKKGVVFVTINYRLNVFGFLALPELTQESEHGSSGNYGLLDQITALKWVKQNISAFGGDPNNVTIDGQSAGAFSINYLVASPPAHGLFQRAIAESGGNVVPNPMHRTLPQKEAEQKGQKLMKKLQVQSLRQLRKIPADSIYRAADSFSPNIDGYVLPKPIASIFAHGEQNDVSTLTGWNADEGTAFTIYSKPTTAKAFNQQARQMFGERASKFLQYYPAQNDDQAQTSQMALTRDLLFAIQNYEWANLQSETGKSNVYLYSFDRKLPAKGDFKFFGAFHSGEIAYALDNLKYLDRPWKRTDRHLADVMSSYWVNFAKTGNPNGVGLPEWQAYEADKGKNMELGKTIGVQTIPNKSAMDFLIDYFGGY